MRQLEQDPRTPIARDRWRYVSASRIEITRPAGFDAGAIYEFIYPARDPIVMGLGFAAVRDFVAFMRHESTDASGIPNPLKLDSGPAVDYVLAYGASQSGRFLRDYLWQGFNEDLNGRRVFDGVLASVAGSRKTFVNFRLCAARALFPPARGPLFPGDQFPFSYATTTDPITGKTDGILARCEASGTCPKIMQTEGSTDFWHGRASLLITDGKGDEITIPANVRLYLFASIQHGGGSVAANFPFNHYPANPAEYGAVHRALVVALDQWAASEVFPPPSQFPRVSDGTLVGASPESYGFPPIPGVTYPGMVNELSEIDYDAQPPKPLSGRKYLILVPKVDEDGNEIAGVRVPNITSRAARIRDGTCDGRGLPKGSCSCLARTFHSRRRKRIG